LISKPTKNTTPNLKRLLILDPFGRDVAPFNAAVSAFRTTLARQLGKPVEFDEVPLDLARLAEQLRFETVLADLSARFANLPPGEVDREIMDAERLICEALGLDLAALWQYSDDGPSSFTLTHLDSAQEGPQSSPVQSEGSRLPMAPRSSWMSLGSCPWKCRPSCCAYCRMANSSGWATPRP
jgi:hypothetical protein